MIAGRVRGLALDRTGIVLLGTIVLIGAGRLTLEEAWRAVDVPTIVLLFGLMVVSAQFRLGGFYTAITQRLGRNQSTPSLFLLVVILAAGGLSALLANDIICLAMAPVLIDLCRQRGLRPLPFLIALACAANIGSAATLIGNPQNMLIGQVLQLSFARYTAIALIPTLLGLLACWAILHGLTKGLWSEPPTTLEVTETPFDRWQTAKGIVVLTALVVTFLFQWLPREVAALIAAGVLLTSRRMASRNFLALVDWNLLLLFIGLFVVNHAFAESGMLDSTLATLRGQGIDPSHAPTLFGLTVVLSNMVSNVPAVMLLLPATSHPMAGEILALASTLAGNLILVGSIANLIVVEEARKKGISISWTTHLRYGLPVTFATLAIAAVALALS